MCTKIFFPWACINAIVSIVKNNRIYLVSILCLSSSRDSTPHIHMYIQKQGLTEKKKRYWYLRKTRKRGMGLRFSFLAVVFGLPEVDGQSC